jgi:hypothetical protein
MRKRESMRERERESENEKERIRGREVKRCKKIVLEREREGGGE